MLSQSESFPRKFSFLHVMSQFSIQSSEIKILSFNRLAPSHACKWQVVFIESSGFLLLLLDFWKLQKDGKSFLHVILGSPAPQAVPPLLPTSLLCQTQCQILGSGRVTACWFTNRWLSPSCNTGSRCAGLCAGCVDPSQTHLTNQSAAVTPFTTPQGLHLECLSRLCSSIFGFPWPRPSPETHGTEVGMPTLCCKSRATNSFMHTPQCWHFILSVCLSPSLYTHAFYYELLNKLQISYPSP